MKRDYIHTEIYPDDDYRHILGIDDPTHEPSKLQQISANTLQNVAKDKKPLDTQGCGIDRSFYVSSEDYENEIVEFDKLHGKPLNLGQRIAQVYPQMAIAAEFKRASPSKGDINPDLDAVTQCMEYAKVGAAVISVLTDYKWFKGTLQDMKKVRLATQKELGSTPHPRHITLITSSSPPTFLLHFLCSTTSANTSFSPHIFCPPIFSLRTYLLHRSQSSCDLT